VGKADKRKEKKIKADPSSHLFGPAKFNVTPAAFIVDWLLVLFNVDTTCR
jgi:hypothetical protein